MACRLRLVQAPARRRFEDARGVSAAAEADAYRGKESANVASGLRRITFDGASATAHSKTLLCIRLDEEPESRATQKALCGSQHSLGLDEAVVSVTADR